MSVLVDSNVVIYASKLDGRGEVARTYIEQVEPAVSAISRVEALGYHGLRPTSGSCWTRSSARPSCCPFRQT